MSEYQYYEFKAVDRRLSETDREALRDLSTRARITATSFTNSYEWGDFKGDPTELMERWFDLHLYFASWGSRRLMIRLPARLIDRRLIDTFLGEIECAGLHATGDNLILDIVRNEVEADDWADDGSGWLVSLAPLRADVLAGDLRLFYLLWLTKVEADVLQADAPEPMPGIGPLTSALEAFAEFFVIDYDLLQAAAERSPATVASAQAATEARQIISAMGDCEKTEMLTRLFDGDPHVAAELRANVRNHMTTAVPPAACRTVGELRARAQAIGLAREEAAAEERAAEQKRRAEEAEKARRVRIAAIKQKGEGVWHEREAKSSVATRPATTRRQAFCRLEVIAEKPAFEDFLRRVAGIPNGMPERDGSSNDCRNHRRAACCRDWRATIDEERFSTTDASVRFISAAVLAPSVMTIR